MKYVSIYELRNNLASLMEFIASGNAVVVTKHNKPIAKIQYYTEAKDDSPFMKFYGALKDDGVSGEEFVNRIRRNSRELKRVEYFRHWSKKKRKSSL